MCERGIRAKLADHQPIVIAGRIVIQHVPPLELRRVFKIVVERVVANYDVGVGNDALQIADRRIAWAWKLDVGIIGHFTHAVIVPNCAAIGNGKRRSTVLAALLNFSVA
jgi:hypothetical protein